MRKKIFLTIFITFLGIFGFLVFKVEAIDKGNLNYNQFFSLTPENIVLLTNLERKKYNIPELKVSPLLSYAALNKAFDMIKKDYFSHTSTDGKRFYEFIDELGYRYEIAGENLAINFTESSSLINAWMKSKTHRANILFPGYKEIGVSVVKGDLQGKETIVIVQLFGDGDTYENSFILSGKYIKDIQTKNRILKIVKILIVIGSFGFLYVKSKKL